MVNGIIGFCKRHKMLLALMTVLSIAIFFRFWQIKTLPDGLFPDEAANGLDVNSILKGDRSPFFERGNGREGLFFYLLAASVEFFGRGPWQHHIVSASIGVLEVLATFFLTRRLFNLPIAALAAFFMATSVWHIVLSRTAFRAIMIPLFTTLAFYFIVKFIQGKDNRQKIYSAIFAGAFFALGFYTYVAYRMMIFIIFALAAAFIYIKLKGCKPPHHKTLSAKERMNNGVKSQLILSKATTTSLWWGGKVSEIFAPYKKYIAVAAISALIVVSPLAYYFKTHPGSFIGRSGQVSIFSPALNKGDVAGTFFGVVQKTALSFFTKGDLNWRHNVSGEPFLPALVSPFFLIGLLYALWRSLRYVFSRTDFGDGKYLILTAWFFAMLMPEITTAEGIPHGLRLIGVIPAVFIFPAIALVKIMSYSWKIFKENFIAKKLLLLALGIYFVLIFINSYNLYFNHYANSPEAYYFYRSDLTTVSNYLNRRNNKVKTYLSLDKFSEQTVLYLTTETNNPYQLVTPEKSYEVKLKSGDQIIFTQSTLFDIVKFRQYHLGTKLVYEEKNKFGQTIMEVLEE